jgi:hypothetical protein
VYNVPLLHPDAPFVAGLPVVFQQMIAPLLVVLIVTNCGTAYEPVPGVRDGVELAAP